MYCHQCGEYYHETVECPDCPSALFGRRRLKSSVLLSDVVSYFEHHGWLSGCMFDGLGDEEEAYLLKHGDLTMPMVVMRFDERVGITYLVVWIYICDSSHCSKDLKELALTLNSYQGVFKCQLSDDYDLLSALFVYPLHQGILINELVFTVEDELYILASLVSELLGIDLGDLSLLVCCG